MTRAEFGKLVEPWIDEYYDEANEHSEAHKPEDVAPTEKIAGGTTGITAEQQVLLNDFGLFLQAMHEPQRSAERAGGEPTHDIVVGDETGFEYKGTLILDPEALVISTEVEEKDEHDVLYVRISRRSA